MDERLKERYIKRKDEQETDCNFAYNKALGVAALFGIKINFDCKMKRSGSYEFGSDTITINPDRATAYTILHEIGHVMYGLSCCTEHCEYVAHGIAIGLAHAYNIILTRDDIELIDCYSNYSAECPADKTSQNAASATGL